MYDVKMIMIIIIKLFASRKLMKSFKSLQETLSIQFFFSMKFFLKKLIKYWIISFKKYCWISTFQILIVIKKIAMRVSLWKSLRSFLTLDLIIKTINVKTVIIFSNFMSSTIKLFLRTLNFMTMIHVTLMICQR